MCFCRMYRRLSPYCQHNTSTWQGKGAVGRFFSELTRAGTGGDVSQQAAAAAASGSYPAASPLGRAQSSSTTGLSRQGSLGAAIPASKLLPSSAGFDPVTYLAVFHGGSSAVQLAAGVRALERQLGESTGQLKQLVGAGTGAFVRVGAGRGGGVS